MKSIRNRPPAAYVAAMKKAKIQQLAMGIVARGGVPPSIPFVVAGLNAADIKKAHSMAAGRLKTIQN